MELQSIEDFEKEMDALDAVKAITASSKPIRRQNPQPLPKKPKRTVDADALEVENRAKEEMGNEDWISKLNSLLTSSFRKILLTDDHLVYRNAHPIALPVAQPTGPPLGLDFKEVIITSGIPRFAFSLNIAESSQQFGGVSVSFSNKKDAKRFAAKKAIDWLIENNYIPSRGNSNGKSDSSRTINLEAALTAEREAREEIGNESWVSKLNGLFRIFRQLGSIDLRLLDYRHAHPVVAPTEAPPPGALPGLDYKEIVLNSAITRFAFTVEIAESSLKFGGEVLSFSNKKDAKAYAAKKAIDWLIANNYMPSNGPIRFPKPPPPVQSTQFPQRKPVPPSDQSTLAQGSIKYAALIPPLCGKLGFGPPQYEITQAKDDGIPFYNGYAIFPGNPIVEGKVGKVFNVHGQKKAKEQCAEIVYSFLKDIERQRGEELDLDGRKRKRSSGDDKEILE